MPDFVRRNLAQRDVDAAFELAEAAVRGGAVFAELLGVERQRTTMQIGFLMAAILVTFPDITGEQLAATVQDLNSRLACHAAEPVAKGRAH